MLIDFVIPFIAIFLAELGDKTQLAVLTLATKHKEHFSLFWGAMLGFLLVDGLAIVFGDIITLYIPMTYVKIGVGILFIVFGIVALFSKDGEMIKIKQGATFKTAFIVIFIAELGDKTQITAGLFATQYNPYIVFLAVMCALGLLTALAIFIGNRLKNKINQKYMTAISGILFIIIGVATLFPVVKTIF
ncbi:MAG: TMEM165/GDT1 family protein [Candidatus Woesearchaeota archaeon]|jgi:putative Ca2+/H+ antiporter (TMEM165/GDT1 family)